MPINEAVRGKRVFVGLSGGVDSAVSAALLKEAGAEVFGVFIQGWYPPGQPCTWKEDRRDAMRVAAHLSIPFHTLDASVEYKRGVIDYLLSEYAAGRTPNPDVMCNREVKFGAFYRFAKEYDADFIATGHYAQTMHNKDFSVHMLRGKDASKDQSYFLWAVPRDVLAHTIFPVGGMPKPEVRALADRFALPVAEKKDSQGVCFLGSISVDEFLRQEIGTVSGDAFSITEEGRQEMVGQHDGALLYTLGERIALEHAAPGPWFVIAKDLEKNVLVVSKAPHTIEQQEHIMLRDENWFLDPSTVAELTAQFRYHGEHIAGTYDVTRHAFIPQHPAALVASGQSLVLYAGEECIGGGIIV